MSRLTRDGTAEPVSQDQILRHARGQGNIIFPVQLITSRIGNLTRLIHTVLYVMTIHTYIHIRSEAERVMSRTLPVCHPLTEVMGVQHYRSYEAFLLGSYSSLVVLKEKSECT